MRNYRFVYFSPKSLLVKQFNDQRHAERSAGLCHGILHVWRNTASVLYAVQDPAILPENIFRSLCNARASSASSECLPRNANRGDENRHPCVAAGAGGGARQRRVAARGGGARQRRRGSGARRRGSGARRRAAAATVLVRERRR
jgi:hypothetical protein